MSWPSAAGAEVCVARRRRVGADFGRDARRYARETQRSAGRHHVGSHGGYGRPKLVWGNEKPWCYAAYDEQGRETLRIEQRDGSACPVDELTGDSAPRVIGSIPRTFTAFAKVFSYPSADSSYSPQTFDQPRSVSTYVLAPGRTPLVIDITTSSYLDFLSDEGWPCENVARSSWRAGETEETRFDSSVTGVPIMLRGRPLRRVDASGVTTQYAYTLGHWNPAVRVFTPFDGGDVWRCVSRCEKDGVLFATVQVNVFDATYGHEYFSAMYLASDTTFVHPFETVTRAYDSRNRECERRYADGSYEQSVYSCCRLLRRTDRTGAEVLRSATTGTDHLYYAEEETSLAQLPRRAGEAANHRITQHFFDVLGRETSTMVRTAATAGEAVDAGFTSPETLQSQTYSWYDIASSGHTRHTDVRGVQTETFQTQNEAYTQTDTYVTAVGDDVSVSETRNDRNGGTQIYRAADGKWMLEKRWTDYPSLDGRVETVATEASGVDGCVTNSVRVFDSRGRIVRLETPVSVVTNAYDGDSTRLLVAHNLTSDVLTRYHYNARGERIGETARGVTVWNETANETDASNVIWRVTRQAETDAGGVTNRTVETWERLTGLSDDCCAETRAYRNGTLVMTSRTTRDPVTHETSENVWQLGKGTMVTRRLFGYVVSITTSADEENPESTQTLFNYYDSFGRVVATEKQIGTNTVRLAQTETDYTAAGDVAARRVRHDADTYAETSFAVDAFGRVERETDALGATVTRTYNQSGQCTGEDGAVYPRRLEYDAFGRRIALATTRDEGTSLDETQWTFDPATALCRTKTDAAGGTVSYTYTPDGLPQRTTWARGAWREHAYDANRNRTGMSCSDGSTFTLAYEGAK